MTDRELLEAAAKAAGVFVWPDVYDSERGLHHGTCGWWNPLTDDGDALRLAVRKCFHVCVFAASNTAGIQSPGFIEVWQDGDFAPLVVEYVQGGAYEAATRRAIVRAAAGGTP